MKKFRYRIHKTNGMARLGTVNTLHGSFKTPAFMPVGTRASIKTISSGEARDAGVQILLGNTYHLFLKPGDKLIKKMGGLHQFMNWDRPILTDSGGYQVFSLGESGKGENLVRIYRDRVEFKSHLDGSKHIFTPKSVLDIQNNLGTDIAMVLDECAPGKSDFNYSKRAMERTHAWAKEAKDYADRKKLGMAIFGIVQGATFKELREKSAQYINSLGFDGNAIGGFAVGESKEKMYQALSAVIPHLDPEKPRYLMGVGSPVDIVKAVGMGIDMFDSVMPTRIARNGTVMTFKGQINLNNARFASDKGPIEKGCDCYACGNFSRGYIRHLINVGEILGIRLTTIHNIRFMEKLMEGIRAAIKVGKYDRFRRNFEKGYR